MQLMTRIRVGMVVGMTACLVFVVGAAASASLAVTTPIATTTTGTLAEHKAEQSADALAALLAKLSTESHSGIYFSEANQAFQLALQILPTASTYVSYGTYLVDAKQYSRAATEFMNAVHLKAMDATNFHSALEGLYNIVVAGLSDGYEHLTVTAGEDLRQALRLYAQEQTAVAIGVVKEAPLPKLTGADQLAEGMNALLHNQTQTAARFFATITPSSIETTGHEWIEIIALTVEPKLWKGSGLLGTVARHLVEWGLVKSK